MKTVLLSSSLMMLLGMVAHARDASPGSAGQPKILVAFFSLTNNTKTMAGQIQSTVGGDLFHVRTLKPYPNEYQEVTRVARAEQDNNERPELAETIPVEKMKEYDVIFLGYPNWWGTIPMALFTFLEQYDLHGKTVIPFCTHGGSGLGRGPGDIQTLCSGATLLPGLAIHGSAVSRAQEEVNTWLNRIGMTGK